VAERISDMISAFSTLSTVEREPAATTRLREGERDPRAIREEVPPGYRGRMWGAAVIPRLSSALKDELPEVKGFSERNIKRMLAFFREYPDLGGGGIVPQAVAQTAGGSSEPCQTISDPLCRRSGGARPAGMPWRRGDRR